MNKHLRYSLFNLLPLFASFFLFACNEPDTASNTATPTSQESPKAPIQQTTPAPPPAAEPSAEVVSTRQSPVTEERATRDGRNGPQGDLPPHVRSTLEYIRQNNRAPDGYVGGRVFENRERRLPVKNARGQRIRYREWDVYPKRPGKNRGPERIVTSDDQKAYYTRDHYRSFKPVER